MTESASPRLDSDTGPAPVDEPAESAGGIGNRGFAYDIGAPSWAASRDDSTTVIFIAIVVGVAILTVIALIAGASGSPQFSIGLGLGIGVGAVPYLIFVGIHAGVTSRSDPARRRRRMTREEWERVFGPESAGGAASGPDSYRNSRGTEQPGPEAIREAALLRAYELLGLSPEVGNRELRSAYHRLAQRHHPDKVARQSEEARAVAEHSMRQINAAYALIRESRRKEPSR